MGREILSCINLGELFKEAFHPQGEGSVCFALGLLSPAHGEILNLQVRQPL